MTSQELVDALLDGKTLTHSFFGRNGRVHVLHDAEEGDRHHRLVVFYKDNELGWSRETNKESIARTKPESVLKHIYIDTLNLHRDNVMMIREQYWMLKDAYSESGWSIWEPTDGV